MLSKQFIRRLGLIFDFRSGLISGFRSGLLLLLALISTAAFAHGVEDIGLSNSPWVGFGPCVQVHKALDSSVVENLLPVT
ncbi:MAG: hypothetical protein OXC05_15155 [Halieaceae bacterium]|nr:hypothetical protein [Halieaceae bacterium]